MKELLGSMYFTPQLDLEGKLRSRYEGTIVGFIVRRDDGIEFEVRKSKHVTPGKGVPLKRSEVETLIPGEPVAMLNDDLPQYTIIKAFPLTGDVWVRGMTSQKDTVVKYHELKRPT